MVSVSTKLNPVPTSLCHMIYYHCDKLVGIGLSMAESDSVA